MPKTWFPRLVVVVEVLLLLCCDCVQFKVLLGQEGAGGGAVQLLVLVPGAVLELMACGRSGGAPKSGCPGADLTAFFGDGRQAGQ